MTTQNTRRTRRDFLQAAVAAGTTLPLAGNWTASTATAVEKRSANDKLNLAVIGVAGRGGSNLAGVSGENIVALCDIDANRLAAAAAKHPPTNHANSTGSCNPPKYLLLSPKPVDSIMRIAGSNRPLNSVSPIISTTNTKTTLHIVRTRLRNILLRIDATTALSAPSNHAIPIFRSAIRRRGISCLSMLIVCS